MSGLLAIMSMGIVMKQVYGELAARISIRYNKLWVAAEVILFVLVGATVNLKYVLVAGILAATMSTADSQLLAASSSVSQNIMNDVFGIKMSQKMQMVALR